jgi:hypothetical protein
MNWFGQGIREGCAYFIFHLNHCAPVLFHTFGGSLKWGKSETETAGARSLRILHYVYQRYCLMHQETYKTPARTSPHILTTVIGSSNLFRSSSSFIGTTSTIASNSATIPIYQSPRGLAEIWCKRSPNSCSSIFHIEPSASSIWTSSAGVSAIKGSATCSNDACTSFYLVSQFSTPLNCLHCIDLYSQLYSEYSILSRFLKQHVEYGQVSTSMLSVQWTDASTKPTFCSCALRRNRTLDH